MLDNMLFGARFIVTFGNVYKILFKSGINYLPLGKGRDVFVVDEWKDVCGQGTFCGRMRGGNIR